MSNMTNNQTCALCGYPIMKHVVPPHDTHPSQIGMTGLWCPTDRRLKNPKPPRSFEDMRACGPEDISWLDQ